MMGADLTIVIITSQHLMCKLEFPQNHLSFTSQKDQLIIRY